MILIEEDGDRAVEESCTTNEVMKENTNRKSNKKYDEFSQPRALKKSGKADHGIKISVMRDERVANHLK
jgi:hypothetical protein